MARFLSGLNLRIMYAYIQQNYIHICVLDKRKQPYDQH